MVELKYIIKDISFLSIYVWLCHYSTWFFFSWCLSDNDDVPQWNIHVLLMSNPLISIQSCLKGAFHWREEQQNTYNRDVFEKYHRVKKGKFEKNIPSTNIVYVWSLEMNVSGQSFSPSIETLKVELLMVANLLAKLEKVCASRIWGLWRRSSICWNISTKSRHNILLCNNMEASFRYLFFIPWWYCWCSSNRDSAEYKRLISYRRRINDIVIHRLIHSSYFDVEYYNWCHWQNVFCSFIKICLWLQGEGTQGNVDDCVASRMGDVYCNYHCQQINNQEQIINWKKKNPPRNDHHQHHVYSYLTRSIEISPPHHSLRNMKFVKRITLQLQTTSSNVFFLSL